MHFLHKDEVGYFNHLVVGRPYAAVKVEHQNNRELGDHLVICAGEEVSDNIIIVKGDTQMAPLPVRVKVLSPDGEIVKPSKGRKFFVSTETFNPYHLVLEAEELPLR